MLRVELRAVLPAVEVGRAQPVGERLEGEHVLGADEVAGDEAHALRVRRLHLGGDGGEGFGPGGRRQAAVAADVGPVETLRLEAVDDVPGLVGDPLLVHVVVDARQDAQDLAAARVDADVGAERVHHVDDLGLGHLPGAGLEGRRLLQKRAHGAEIGDIALQLGPHGGFEIGRDLHVLATTDGAHVARPRHLGGEADTARAVDAAVHRRPHDRADVLVLDGPLVLVEARAGDAEGHRLILQVAFAALVADRAIQRMVDQQKFHDAMAGLLDHGRLGRDLGSLAVRAGPAVAHAPGAGGHRLRRALELDETHAAIAGDRQPLMEAEARDLGAGGLAGLQERVIRRNVDFPSVDDDLGHRYPFKAEPSRFSPRGLGSDIPFRVAAAPASALVLHLLPVARPLNAADRRVRGGARRAPRRGPPACSAPPVPLAGS